MRGDAAQAVASLACVAFLGAGTGCALAQPAGQGSTSAAACALSSSDREWTRTALEGWELVNAARLRIAVVPPSLVLFDEACVHTFMPARAEADGDWLVAAGQAFQIVSAPHDGQVALPGGDAFPAGLTSFAAPGPGGRMSFVMSLPSMWRARAVASDHDLLATVVFLHEFTHTQSASLAAEVDVLVVRGLPADADDDVVQSRFGERPGFQVAYEGERNLLYQAAFAPAADSDAVRSLAADAWRLMERRRGTFFTGADGFMRMPRPCS